jgi:hypothetical protein
MRARVPPLRRNLRKFNATLVTKNDSPNRQVFAISATLPFLVSE